MAAVGAFRGIIASKEKEMFAARIRDRRYPLYNVSAAGGHCRSNTPRADTGEPEKKPVADKDVAVSVKRQHRPAANPEEGKKFDTDESGRKNDRSR
jgi:hypothetical protein